MRAIAREGLPRPFTAGTFSRTSIVKGTTWPSTEFADALDPKFLPGVHRRLGELYEAKGDASKAAEHYRAFIDLWKNADPELQPRVTEVRQRLAKLAPVEKPKS